MKKQDVIDTVNAIMAEKTGINASDIKPEDFYGDLCEDSIQCLEALLEIEEELCININSRKLSHITAMQDVYDIVGNAIADTHGFEIS